MMMIIIIIIIIIMRWRGESSNLYHQVSTSFQWFLRRLTAGFHQLGELWSNKQHHGNLHSRPSTAYLSTHTYICFILIGYYISTPCISCPGYIKINRNIYMFGWLNCRWRCLSYIRVMYQQNYYTDITGILSPLLRSKKMNSDSGLIFLGQSMMNCFCFHWIWNEPRPKSFRK